MGATGSGGPSRRSGEITARGKVLTLWVNGAVTCQFEDCGAPTGYLGVEGEGCRIEFRNLKLKARL